MRYGLPTLLICLVMMGAGCTAADQSSSSHTSVSTGIYTNTSVEEMRVNDFNAQIDSPLLITGEARGTWFFEATAPVVIVNWDGLIIGEGYIQTTDNWMTEEFVPFEGTIEFDRPDYGDTGAVILHNANPSDLPEYDRAVEIPIRFK